MWVRTPSPNNLPATTVAGLTSNGDITLNGNEFMTGTLRIRSSNDPGLYWAVETGSTRTTFGLQCQPTFHNTWFTSATGVLQLTFAMYPDGFIHVAGILSNATNTNRNDNTWVADLNATTFSKRFIPQMEIHMLADGSDRANNQQPVFVLGADGNIFCFNLDNTTAAQVDYRINCTYNKLTFPGKYENTGGGPT